LIETIEYFDNQNLRYELDVPAKLLLDQIIDGQKNYEKVVIAVSQLRKQKTPIQQPSRLIRRLKEYQLRGLAHLLEVENGANFSVPGSGKTTVIYAAFDKLREDDVVDKLFVIGPRSCFQPWEDEATACLNYSLKIIRLVGSKASRKSTYYQADDYDLFLSTYQTASNDEAEIIDLCKRYRIFMVIDESHNIKRMEGGIWAEAILNVGQFAIRRAVLSGTPIPNSLTDLWTQITFLWPNEQVLRDRNSFRFRCEDKTEVPEIQKAIKPFIFRVTKRELGLPAPQFEYHYCDLNPYQKSIYHALATKLLQELTLEPTERIVLREWRKAKIVRLIQAATNPTLLAKYSEEFDVPPLSGEGISPVKLIEKYPKYEMPTKFVEARNIIREIINQGQKVILWTTFIFNIQMLQQLFADLEPLIVYGGIPKDESEDIEFNREQQIRKFKESSNPELLIANPAACAESISLHKVCHHAVYLDRTYNCGQYMQSLDRIHRIGLAPDELVFYHLLIAKNTIDETIDRRLEEKKKTMLNILEAEIPIGTFEVEGNQLGQSEDEEKVDFAETIKDLKKQLDEASIEK
jgi:SNF2 family DNA or RNA helicase